MKQFLILSAIFLFGISLFSQSLELKPESSEIPSVYHNLKYNEAGFIVYASPFTKEEALLYESPDDLTLGDLRNTIIGTEKGLKFTLQNEKLDGYVYYGLYADQNVKYPQVVFFHKTAKLVSGEAEIDLSLLKGKYDIANWEDKGVAKIGYRIANKRGQIIYDGKVYVSGFGPFKPITSIVEGPFVNKQTPDGVTISFTTNIPCSPHILVNGKEYATKQMMGNMQGDTYHEISIGHLKSDTEYEYTSVVGKINETHSFKTAPIAGSRNDFTFAFTSDSRAGNGGGERSIRGVNVFIMKKMAALAVQQNSVFFQFTGDMINGKVTNINDQNLQYANWKRAVEPFWHYIPFNTTMGNHEGLLSAFDDGSKYGKKVAKFPFKTKSAERIFANNFVNPENGPISEDGSKYDPNKDKIDFPSYSENVFYYIYDNVAMVVLNSNYLYTPNINTVTLIGGNIHGYIMDNQLKWLKEIIKKLDKDTNIDHVFVTIHTPAFPNGGHANNDMWYYGNDSIRPFLNGKAVDKGIIERRDEFLDIIINKSDKVLALLCGDEHNYSRMKIENNTPRYPDNYLGKKLKMKRDFWQITNGSAGAPYYGQEILPWSASVEKFSTQYALMLFDIKGEKVGLRVINPDTFELIEEIQLLK